MLTSKELMVVATKQMHMPMKQAREYLKKCGYPMGANTYKAIYTKVSKSVRDRMFEIARNQEVLHMEKHDSLKACEMAYWQLFYSKKKVIMMSVQEVKEKDRNGKPVTTRKKVPVEMEVEQTPIERAQILTKIVETLPYISSVEEVTRDVMEEAARDFEAKGGILPKA